MAETNEIMIMLERGLDNVEKQSAINKVARISGLCNLRFAFPNAITDREQSPLRKKFPTMEDPDWYRHLLVNIAPQESKEEMPHSNEDILASLRKIKSVEKAWMPCFINTLCHS